MNTERLTQRYSDAGFAAVLDKLTAPYWNLRIQAVSGVAQAQPPAEPREPAPSRDGGGAHKPRLRVIEGGNEPLDGETLRRYVRKGEALRAEAFAGALGRAWQGVQRAARRLAA